MVKDKDWIMMIQIENQKKLGFYKKLKTDKFNFIIFLIFKLFELSSISFYNNFNNTLLLWLLKLLSNSIVVAFLTLQFIKFQIFHMRLIIL